MDRFNYKVSVIMAFVFLTMDIFNSYESLELYSFGVVIIGTVISYFIYLLLSYVIVVSAHQVYNYFNNKEKFNEK